MKKLLFAFAAVMLISAPLGAWADDMLSSTPTPSPTNSEPIPTPLTDAQPVILGHVVGATSHSVTVSTPEAERITFEFDSRTVMPRQLVEGTPVRVEFHLMDNGMHHAGRITPLERGSNDWMRLEDRHAAAIDNAEEDAERERQEQAATNQEEMNSTAPASDASTTDGTNDNVLLDTNSKAAEDRAAENNENGNQLPQTASEQPWLLLFGTAAAVVAIGLTLRRRARA